MHRTLGAILSLAISASLAGCAGSCEDYRNSPLGPPAGCDCLYSAFGCSILDVPSSSGAFGASSMTDVRAAGAAGAEATWKMNLTKQGTGCPFLPRNVRGPVRVSRTGKRAQINLGGGHVVSGAVRNGRMNARSTIAGYAQLPCTTKVAAEITGFTASARKAKVRVAVGATCVPATLSCKTSYSGSLGK